MVLFRSTNSAITISGKFGGAVFSHKPDGNHIATRPRRYGPPPTLTQIARRAAFSSASQAWARLLTNDQRLAWTLYGDRHPRSGRTGHPYTMTGRHAFLHINIIRLFNDLDPTLDPPAD